MQMIIVRMMIRMMGANRNDGGVDSVSVGDERLS